MTSASGSGTCITIGNFDGVHLGHQALIALAREAAAEAGLDFELITFWPHPRLVIAGGASHTALAARPERLRLLAGLGIDTIRELSFTPGLASLSAEEFVTGFLLPRDIKILVIGHDFNLGRDREGSAAVLAQLGAKYGFEVRQAQPFAIAGEPVSSTRLRASIKAGAVACAARMLGRHYALSGQVGHGYGRGAGLGFPTANLVNADTLAPGPGVYATLATACGRRMPAVTNIGFNPTFGNFVISIETFLLDTNASLYGSDLRLEFVERLRSERKFASPGALTAQINLDVAKARSLLSGLQ